MSVEIQALIVSVNEPQLNMCLDSIRNQTKPFNGLVHINGVSPESDAFNKGISSTDSEWVMHIGGDFILNRDAVETASNYISSVKNSDAFGFFFGLYDTFLDCMIGYCSVLRGPLYRSFAYPNKLSNDRKMKTMFRKMGYTCKKKEDILLGTHFDNPDEFQVFRRFYIQEIKWHNDSFIKPQMTKLYEKTGNPLYLIGLKANAFAKLKKVYPGSHDLNFDRKLFEEFKRMQNENLI